jgi:nucleotidyltransferase/DNA polymerase involved in DNA repair
MSKKSPLEEIPGIGPNLAAHLHELGIECVGDLRRKNPEILYAKLTKLRGCLIDRCVLYAFRCAVYYAQDGRDPKKLKWWNWKQPNSSPNRSIRRKK